ncbi:MAG: hypothetical protein COV60_02270 [Candidatus Magasanikbacteria bacterium CG11_big_fil_rev_8_21_14_0_20_43_7]|uniref:Pseudouridine synthase n=1 Tax=Candidatus Magasanikbacteria bacterium CG11_big_fil_rev_8_21_14_0_20_43_7 TaxID=1974654 RepID=A0A2H0N2B2_9BACT|nr:MAG: hypothetical protein COV60_02270 [Candidatus Magasanikbacteria bacterium CG11_big_fil_rev_8_21_14_0_20_43_7]
MIRLNKHIADLGICSRRKADDLIIAGKVRVNGTAVKELGTKVDPDTDIITVLPVADGEIQRGSRDNTTTMFPTKKITASSIGSQTNKWYIALNKPVDYVSSTTNEFGASVLELITPDNYYKQAYRDDAKKLANIRLYPVGRLDKDSEGLLLLTNDGDLTNQLTHPRYEHEKEYEVTIDKQLTKDVRIILSKGMLIDGEQYGAMEIKKEFNKGRRVILTLILREGKNRHIRKMLGRLGYNISVLRRVRINKLKLGTLSIGKWKFVEKSDIV